MVEGRGNQAQGVFKYWAVGPRHLGKIWKPFYKTGENSVGGHDK